MKKKFDLIDLDCAACGAKMEAAVKKIEGVNDASVSYINQRLVLDADDERFEEILKEVVRVCKKVESDCTIVIK
jgi:cation transport ATPase